MRFISSVFIIFAIIFISLSTAGFLWWKSATLPPSSSSQNISIVIKKGSGATQIGNILKEKGAVKSVLSFKLYLQLKGLTKKIPPGEFEIPGNLSLSQVVSLLLKGPTQVWVTIPEGLRKEEIVEIFLSSFDQPQLQKGTFKSEFLSLASTQEGYLFPDTYLFPKDTTAQKAVSLLTSTFEKKYASLDITTTLSKKQIITLASILERETITDEERPIVSGILTKRYKNDWPLQADATIQYAIGKSGNWWPRPLTKNDLETTSPYNTYKFIGFPPSPISNPGLSSLQAAASPKQSEFWYYIHDNQGVIHYAETLQEHNQNVQKYLK
jgi:UPF0755 protein